MLIDRRFLAQFDWLTLALIFLIPLLGLVVLYSAGYQSDPTAMSFVLFDFELSSPLAIRQLLNLGFGLLALVAGLLLSPRFIYRYTPILFTAGIILLICVLLFGEVANGARRWVSLGFLKIQPAEYMKFALIIMLARILSRLSTSTEAHGIKALALPITLTLIPMLLILVQPDLGTALALGAVGAFMILAAGVRWHLLFLLSILPVIALVPVSLEPYQPAAIKLLKPYQQRRVTALLDPGSDLQGSGWHIHQSKIAVGSGRLFGKGFLQGSQSQLSFLPEHTTDFIFSVLAEEWGFSGCLLVLALYALIIYRILYISGRSRDPFLGYLAFGVGAQIFFHVFVNVGMVVGLLPVVGLPLPLFSYGGSSLVATLFSLGLVLGVAMRRSIVLNPSGVVE